MDPSTYGITITPTGLTGAAATTYSQQVQEHVTWIDGTRMGRNLLTAIKAVGKAVVIEPFTAGGCNSSGGFRTVGGVVQGHVNYSPDTFSVHGACSFNKLTLNRGLMWDEILFHELVHVLRGVSGVFAKRPLHAALADFDDSEEFFAVVVANIYISDPTNRIKTGLRASHHGFTPLAPAFGSPFAFYGLSPQVFGLVEQIVHENHDFTTMVANTKAEFNPIADYYADSDKAAEISRNAGASEFVGFARELFS